MKNNGGWALALVAVVALGAAAASARQEKGGEDETGPYAVAQGWPASWAQRHLHIPERLCTCACSY